MKEHSPAFLAYVEKRRSMVNEIEVSALPDFLETHPATCVVDIREDHEWDAGHVSFARHLGRGILERDAESSFDPETPIILYCGGGYRSVLSAHALQEMGFTRVYSLAGGFKALQEAGFPVDPASERCEQ